MPQMRFIWKVQGDLEDGEITTLSFDVVTRLNPAGHQEFTSCGLHVLNSGVSLKYMVSGHQQSESSDGWAIWVCQPTPEVTTELSDDEIIIGGTVTDDVTVSGLKDVHGVNGLPYPMPTGNVQFQYMVPGETEWTDLGGPIALDGSGEATSPSTPPLTVVGTYQFRACYESDDNYTDNESVTGTEPLVVTEPVPV